MSYPIGTTLTRNVPFQDEARKPLNYLRVIADSPIVQASVGEWADSASGESVVVTPAKEFGANETVPVSVLQSEYTVEFMPEEEFEIQEQRPRRRVREESPADYFDRVDRERQAAAAAALQLVEEPAVAPKVPKPRKNAREQA